MLARALLLLPVLLASALAQPIPTSSTTSECSPLLALLSNAAGVIGLELPICAQSPPASSTTTTTNTQHAEPAYPESHYDDMDNPADYGDWPLLPDWRETENKEGNVSTTNLYARAPLIQPV